MMTNTQAVLKTYATHRSEDAFRELVANYIGLVYSTALRQVGGDVHLAEDVSQIVFSDLARDAGKLSDAVMLGGWLHQRALNVAKTIMRSERRRQAREKEAVEMSLLEDHTAINLARIGPALDEAISGLNPEDRTAVLSRFFERRDLRSVGEALGVNEDAAQKRVSRALEKMRLSLERSGVKISVAALGAVLAVEEVAAAPAGLAATVTTTALSVTSATSSAAAITVKAMGMTAIQKTTFGVLLAAVLGSGIYEARHAVVERAEKQALLKAQTLLETDIERLRLELDRASNRLAGVTNARIQTRQNELELLTLRSEVGRLQQRSRELEKMKESSLADASWLDRVGRLRQRLEQTPDAQIPELKFLTETDWLIAANGKLETEEDYRAAFSRLRSSAEGAFLRTAETALQNYLSKHHDEFPGELSQLTPYFETPPADDILARYQIAPPGSSPEPDGSGEASGWAITLKTTDAEAKWTLGKTGVGASSAGDAQELRVLAPAIASFIKATPAINGSRSFKIEDLEPYLKTAEQNAAYQKMIQRKHAFSR